ncbi:MAG: S41 family peptidase [Bryobacteraceae bacterium]
MNQRTLVVILLCAMQPVFAQLTPDQRLLDFQNLAAMFAKRYAPGEWKRQVSGFDMQNLQPWLDRVRLAKDDAQFHEISAEFVASLDDGHTNYRAPGNLSASLGFVVDVYDGAVLIEQVDRTRLPEATYPFVAGDEVVSIDGRSVAEWIADFSKLRKRANPLTTRRFAADLIPFRLQSILPRTNELGDTASVVIKAQAGALQTYSIPWVKSGLPYPGSNRIGKFALAQPRNAALENTTPDYMKLLLELHTWAVSDDQMFTGETRDDAGDQQPRRYLLGFGSRTPPFRLPDNFVQRLGKTAAEFHYSGTYEAEGLKIGYLRVPNFVPPPNTVKELETEIQYLSENTDGLVLDITRNAGGGCYLLDVARRLMPYDFFSFGEEIRVTYDRLLGVYNSLEAAKRAQADSGSLTFTRPCSTRCSEPIAMVKTARYRFQPAMPQGLRWRRYSITRQPI